MPIESNIALSVRPPQIESPLQMYGQLAQVQNASNQNRLAQLQFSQAQQAVSDKNALANAYKNSVSADGSIDYGKLIPGLASSGQGAQVPAIVKQKLDYEKSSREAEKAQIEGHLQKINALGQIMGGVKDQASYDMARQQAAQIFGPDFVAQIPPQYDPAFIQQKQAEAMTVADQLGQKWKQLDYNLNLDKFDYQQKNDAANRGVQIRGQDIGANTAAAGRAVTLRGQDLTNARALQLIAQGNKPPSGYRYKPNGDLEMIPGGPADVKNQQRMEGGGTVSNVVGSLRDAYDQLDEANAVTSTNNRAGTNLGAWAANTGLGQTVGSMFGTKTQALRDQIAQQRPILLQAIMRATGMSAKQMDSNTELKLYLSTATDPSKSVQANRKALDMIEKLYGSGAGNASITKPATTAPKTTPAIPGGWSVQVHP